MLKAVIFDYDGVIVNSLKVNFEIYNHICRELGKPCFETVKDFIKVVKGNWNRFWNDIGILSENEKNIASHLYKEGIFRLWDKIVLIDGIDEIIFNVKRKYKLGIATNTYKEFIVSKLMESNLLEHFDSIIDWFSVKKRKPHPDPIIACMKELGSSPEETVYIGDMDDDILAGKNAGVKTIAVAWGWHPINKLIKYEPDIIALRPQDLPELLKRL